MSTPRTLEQISKEFIDQTEIRDRAAKTIAAAGSERSKAEASICQLEVELAGLYAGADHDTVVVHGQHTIIIPVFGKPRLGTRICVRL